MMWMRGSVEGMKEKYLKFELMTNSTVTTFDQIFGSYYLQFLRFSNEYIY